MKPADAAPSSALSDEAAYLTLWQQHELYAKKPADAAYEGGLLADRPAWVFVAGYQAAIRAVFPEVETREWIALAVSEDRANPDAHPRLVARPEESEWLLSGCKSWVAQSRSIGELLVSARLHARIEVFRVGAQIKGLTLTHRAEPSFLRALSQGFARFDESPAARLNDPERLQQFGSVEAVAMMIATAGYLQRVDAPDASGALAEVNACVIELRDLLAEPWAIEPLALRALDEQFHGAFERWQASVDTSALPEFETDRALFTLYRRAIAKRAEAALIKVSEAVPGNAG